MLSLKPIANTSMNEYNAWEKELQSMGKDTTYRTYNEHSIASKDMMESNQDKPMTRALRQH